MIKMASKKRVRAPRTKSVRKISRVRSGARRAYSRAKSGFLGSKIKWGEAALAAIVGYEGNKILEPLASLAISNENLNPVLTSLVNGAYEVGSLGGSSESGSTPGIVAKGMNKTIGSVAMLKVGYDLVKHRTIDSTDINVLIPYALGAAFDAPGSSKNQGAW